MIVNYLPVSSSISYGTWSWLGSTAFIHNEETGVRTPLVVACQSYEIFLFRSEREREQCSAVTFFCLVSEKQILENAKHKVALVSSVLYHVTRPEIAEEQTTSVPFHTHTRAHIGYNWQPVFRLYNTRRYVDVLQNSPILGQMTQIPYLPS
jgi:hypothetical protein